MQSNPAQKTYMIKNLNDFLSIPDDRIDDCLKEFSLAIKINKNTESIMNEIGKEMTKGKKDLFMCELTKFEWTDDGKDEISLQIDL